MLRTWPASKLWQLNSTSNTSNCLAAAMDHRVVVTLPAVAAEAAGNLQVEVDLPAAAGPRLVPPRLSIQDSLRPLLAGQLKCDL